MRKTTIGLLLALTLIALPALASQQPAAEKITQGPVVEGVGDTWAVIAWTTNTGGSTIVRYGTDPNNLSQTGQSSYSDNEKSSAQNHRVRLTNLTPGTTYYFIADSGQGEGTGTEAKSSVQQFTTKGAGQASSTSTGASSTQGNAVKITDGPHVEDVGPTGAVITWTTNTGGSSVVHYGTDRNNLNQGAQAPYSDNDKSGSQTHRVSIGGLKPNTTYYFIADSGQGEGTGTEAKSSIGQFTTKSQ
jgi:phosphodiesterase/alkaline phosphatase D-like protein